MIRRLARKDAGFTVVELLVSLVILALVMSFLPGTLRLGRRVWESDAVFLREEAITSFRRVIEERLTGTMPIFIRDAARGVRIEFTGEPDRVVFVSTASQGPAGGGVYRFELSADDGNALVLRQTLYRPGSEAGTPLPEARHVAPARIGGLAFRYFGQAKANEAPLWQARWTRQDTLPDLVEIAITLDGAAPVQRSVVELRLKPPA